MRTERRRGAGRAGAGVGGGAADGALAVGCGCTGVTVGLGRTTFAGRRLTPRRRCLRLACGRRWAGRAGSFESVRRSMPSLLGPAGAAGRLSAARAGAGSVCWVSRWKANAAAIAEQATRAAATNAAVSFGGAACRVPAALGAGRC